MFLAGHPNVHAPKTSNDVHGKHDRAEYGELAEDVSGLLLPLVHADVDLSKVIGMRAREDPMSC